MLRRLLIALMVLGLALPAIVMPSAPLPATVMPEGHVHEGHSGSDGHPDKDTPAASPHHHECIGCIAPLMRFPAIDGQSLLPQIPARPDPSAPLAALGSAPEIPPPRT